MTARSLLILEQLGLDIQSAHARQADIQQDASGLERPGCRQKHVRTVERDRLEIRRTQQTFQRTKRRRRHHPERRRFVQSPFAAPPDGRVKRKMVPPSGFGSAFNWPSCASIIEREIDSPNPMPSCLLDTNGSNNRPAMSPGIPVRYRRRRSRSCRRRESSSPR